MPERRARELFAIMKLSNLRRRKAVASEPGRLMWINGPLRGRSYRPTVHRARGVAVVMRLHSYRDESQSRRLDLIGGGGHPWSIDLVSVTASGILVVGLVH